MIHFETVSLSLSLPFLKLKVKSAWSLILAFRGGSPPPCSQDDEGKSGNMFFVEDIRMERINGNGNEHENEDKDVIYAEQDRFSSMIGAPLEHFFVISRPVHYTIL